MNYTRMRSHLKFEPPFGRLPSSFLMPPRCYKRLSGRDRLLDRNLTSFITRNLTSFIICSLITFHYLRHYLPAISLSNIRLTILRLPTRRGPNSELLAWNALTSRRFLPSRVWLLHHANSAAAPELQIAILLHLRLVFSHIQPFLPVACLPPEHFPAGHLLHLRLFYPPLLTLTPLSLLSSSSARIIPSKSTRFLPDIASS